MKKGEFSVYQFFPDDRHEEVARFIGAEAAVKLAERLCSRFGARRGLVERIIITDGGDHTVFEWKHGEGVTFPTKEMRSQA